jgi:hypothetical protein
MGDLRRSLHYASAETRLGRVRGFPLGSPREGAELTGQRRQAGLLGPLCRIRDECGISTTDQAISDVRDAQSRRTPLTVAERARVRGHCAAAVDAIRSGTRLLLGLNGTSGFATTQPIQRIWRDIEVAASHRLLNTRTAREIAGRELLGMPQTTPTL